ncbi:hypothetical protein LOTGIDRAFT_103779 [Lottia gigantea]|uniref:DNA oxidative demethylase ALKBH2 n=1 Tax=Lottia gigantea TaxID=225164 RepID=V4A217_LOTGI|nr:hypothetical protein LOTGIDRAFT_103779 [Lottia gigantea]ESO97863.1 hypothetical protein LOTGIDRAFT_103779 [Lottia gigantea]
MDLFVVKTKRKRADSQSESSGSKKFKSYEKSECNVIDFKKFRLENLSCDYGILYSKREADNLLKECEKILCYNEGKLAKICLFGKWHNIPRKQVAHGDEGLSYKFSGNSIPARPWLPLLENIRDDITRQTGYKFNFVLINRYKDGSDYMGEHKDDEKDLEADHPIASLSLGQARDFIFKHQDSRGKNSTRRDIPPLKLVLQHGGLLMMNYPTNSYWYHSLPCRKKLFNVRINMTFRKMVVK